MSTHVSRSQPKGGTLRDKLIGYGGAIFTCLLVGAPASVAVSSVIGADLDLIFWMLLGLITLCAVAPAFFCNS